MPHPERILLLRSGRHLQLALAVIKERWPESEVLVVGTLNSAHAVAEAGVPAGSYLHCPQPRFTPLRFALSRPGWRARRWRFDHVAVLWNDPRGTGQGNVDRAALLMAPRGFLAVTPDGRVVSCVGGRQLRHELRRGTASLISAALLAALYIPAFFWPAPRRWRPTTPPP